MCFGVKENKGRKALDLPQNKQCWMDEVSRRATNRPASSASLTPFQKSKGDVLPAASVTVCIFTL